MVMWESLRVACGGMLGVLGNTAACPATTLLARLQQALAVAQPRGVFDPGGGDMNSRVSRPGDVNLLFHGDKNNDLLWHSFRWWLGT